MRRLLLISFLIILSAGLTLAQTGVKKRRPLPYEYGNIVINNFSETAGMDAVVFEHWLHRSKFTCRLCHVDLAFAMKAGTTGIRALDNVGGYYCGTCHNGKSTNNGKIIFEACSKDVNDASARCLRCHYTGKNNPEKKYVFEASTAGFPDERFGNGINWEKAENDGNVKLIDFIEGVSIKRKPLKVQKDFSMNPEVTGMPDIIFSHKKHTVWNGCEVCHPELFYGVKKGLTAYSMVDIFEGKFCGACHGNVAFPLLDCQRCHTKPV